MFPTKPDIHFELSQKGFSHFEHCCVAVLEQLVQSMFRVECVIHGNIPDFSGFIQGEIWLPFSRVEALCWKDGKCYAAMRTKGIQILFGGIQFPSPMATVRVHPDCHDDVKRFMSQQSNPFWDVLQELRYNPQFGSQLETIRQHFEESVQKM